MFGFGSGFLDGIPALLEGLGGASLWLWLDGYICRFIRVDQIAGQSAAVWGLFHALYLPSFLFGKIGNVPKTFGFEGSIGINNGRFPRSTKTLKDSGEEDVSVKKLTL